MLNKEKIGLVFGSFLAVVHAAWALAVAIMPIGLQSFLDWIFRLHFLVPVWRLTLFNIRDAALLVIVTFVVGYALGWVFAWVHNYLHKKK